MKRWDIINTLIEKYGYASYLEIGVARGECLDRVKCAKKHSVDPVSPFATFRVASDEFFGMLGDGVRYDLIFIDGLHTERQATVDLRNALFHLSPGGSVVVHDCNPPTKHHQGTLEEAMEYTGGEWTGDVWKAIVKLRGEPSRYLGLPFFRTVDTDWGCCVINQNLDCDPDEPLDLRGLDLTYENLEVNRAEWLNLVSPEAWLNLVSPEAWLNLVSPEAWLSSLR